MIATIAELFSSDRGDGSDHMETSLKLHLMVVCLILKPKT